MTQYKIDDGKLLCSFAERMDTNTCIECEEELFETIGNSNVPVLFDLTDVDYVSSAFLRLCLRVSRQVKPENFSVVNVRPNIKKVFKIAGFDNIIAVD